MFASNQAPWTHGEGRAPVTQARVQIGNRLGLHARAAAKLVQLAGTFASEVTLEKDGLSVNAKSVMGVLLLCGAKGTWLTVQAVGEDSEAAVHAICALVEDRFGEPE